MNRISAWRLAQVLATFIVAVAVAHPWQNGTASPVDSKKAADAVIGWLKTDQKPLGEFLGGRPIRRVEPFKGKDGKDAYFVVSLEPSGFVIVAADDSVEPIVGFATTGHFDPAENSPLSALVNGDIPARVEHARRLQAAAKQADAATLKSKHKWQQFTAAAAGGETGVQGAATGLSDVRIAPLTQTTWSQQTVNGVPCYNYYTPNNYPAGCVATAMAQLMRYYCFPNAGVGTASFTITVDNVPQSRNLRGGNGSGGVYDWANMPLVPSNPTTTQCQAIGALVADAGTSVNMSYQPGSSSAYLLGSKTALINTFHFTGAAKGYNSGGELGTNLLQMINPNLDARQPVLLGIQGSAGGHAVVSDGYGYSASTLYHHLNMGWAGTDNAWYALPIIDTPNSPYDFNTVDECLYNIFTNGTGEIISGRVLDQISRPVVNATVTATRSGGGTYSATTDGQGIYALAGIPGSSIYSIVVSKTNFASATNSISTGFSADNVPTSGNRWGVNFTLNMLPTVVDHIVWNSISATQRTDTPFGVTITAQNATNGLATGFTGPVSLIGYFTGTVGSNSILGNLDWEWNLGSSSDMTLGYAFTPSTNLLVTHVRSYFGDKVCIWTDSGTLLASQAVSGTPTTWTSTPLATPILLSPGTTYRVSAHCPASTLAYYRVSWPTSFPNGTVGQTFYRSYGDVFPVGIYGTNQGPLVSLSYAVAYSNTVPVTPTSSGTFVNGVWTGNITVSQVISNMALRADDGAGHVALSNPFRVIAAPCTNVLVTAQPQLTLNSGAAIYGIAPLAGGAMVIGGDFTNVNGTTRKYIARLLPDGTLDPNWNPGASGSVWTLATDGTNVFAGGAFTNMGGLTRNCVAKLQGGGTGVVDPSWNPNADYYVSSLAVAGTDLYAGGEFWYIGGQTRHAVAKLATTGTGAADPTWNPDATTSGNVDALVIAGTNVYVGGSFTTIGGQSRNNIAKLSTSGSGASDPTWNPNVNSRVYALAVSGTNLYIGGAFTTVGGLGRGGIARLSTSGNGAPDSWNPGADNTVLSLAVNGLCVYAGGSFANIGGLSRLGLAKLSANSNSAESSWDAALDGNVWAMSVSGTRLVVAGDFTQIVTLPRHGIAWLTFAPLGLYSPQYSMGGPFQGVLAGDRGQGYEIEVSTNLTNWSTVGSLTNSTGTMLFSYPTAGDRQFYRARQLP